MHTQGATDSIVRSLYHVTMPLTLHLMSSKNEVLSRPISLDLLLAIGFYRHNDFVDVCVRLGNSQNDLDETLELIAMKSTSSANP